LVILRSRSASTLAWLSSPLLIAFLIANDPAFDPRRLLGEEAKSDALDTAGYNYPPPDQHGG
jgi:hypothetical protein